jgi:hypothetical protein
MHANRFGRAAAAALLIVVVAGGPAVADPDGASDPVDRLSLGVAFWDQDLVDPEVGFLDNSDLDDFDHAADFRAEYRWGYSLIPATQPYVAFKPFAGLEVTTDGTVFGLGGVVADIPIGPVVFSPSFGAGLLEEGSGKDMGSVVHGRTTLELGYEFDNRWRISAHYSHISNGGLTETNPGVNLVGAYLHIPLTGGG